MDLQGPGLTYILLVIPTIFSLAVIVQGVYKLTRHEADGKIALGFGIFFLLLVGAAYFFLIR
ncbi:hypothetical protein HY950_02130 [Candidatus Gottesmanbacteria bacterium]|nr:hypothetical protein [Candidatus Gottesmanbacteria bacterium]